MRHLKPTAHSTLALTVLNLPVSLWPEMGVGKWKVSVGVRIRDEGVFHHKALSSQCPVAHKKSHQSSTSIICTCTVPFPCSLHHLRDTTGAFMTANIPDGEQHLVTALVNTRNTNRIWVQEELVLSRQAKPSAVPWGAHNTTGLINPHAQSGLVTQKEWNSKFPQWCAWLDRSRI